MSFWFVYFSFTVYCWSFAGKRKADIIYYCANSASEGRNLLVRINPFGVAYDNVQMLDESGNAVPWCNGTSLSRDTHGTYSLKISLSDDIEDFMGSTCAGNKVSMFVIYLI